MIYKNKNIHEKTNDKNIENDIKIKNDIKMILKQSKNDLKME